MIAPVSQQDLPQTLQNLRTALAVNRGMELLDTVSTEMQATTEDYLQKRETRFNVLFERIHRDMFRDWQRQPGTHAPGDIPDGTNRDRLREVIRTHLIGNHGGEPKLFDANGFVIGIAATDDEKSKSESKAEDSYYYEKAEKRREHCAQYLAEFYGELRKINTFDYGNELTRDFFMMALGKLPAFQAVYGNIDFRRLDKEDFDALHSNTSSRSQLEDAFRHALNPDRTPMLNNTVENPDKGYKPWPENMVYIANIPFLSHTGADNQKYLVTMNGGLVPFTEERKAALEKELRTGNPFVETTRMSKSDVTGYLDGTDALREGYDERGIKFIDGFKTTKDSAPLFCLDANLLSGLRPPSHEKLLSLIELATGRKLAITDLNDNEDEKKRSKPGDNFGNALKEKLKALPGIDERTKRIIDLAYDHVNHVTKKLDTLKLNLFKGKNQSETPTLFVCMGGAASGKSNVADMVQKQCGENNFVVASLDDFRTTSDLHSLLTAANHHADDYTVIEPYANTLRDWVAAYARENHFNLLFDGTGIPYQPRYSQLVTQFKKDGYATQVIGVDRDYTDAVKYVKSRFEDEGRGLPWSVVAGKHARLPRAMLQAIEDAQLDKFSVFANDGQQKKDFSLVAETFNLKAGELAQLEEAQGQGKEKLTEYIASLAQSRPDSILSVNAGGNREAIRDRLKNTSTFRQGSEGMDNTAYLTYTIKGATRALVIYDVNRFNKIMDKSLINPYASDPKERNVLPSSLAFKAEKPSWRERIAEAGKIFGISI